MKIIPNEFKLPAHTHHIVILFIIIIITRLTLCYSIMSHTNINTLLSRIHVKIANLLNIMCTLAATCMILGKLECNSTKTTQYIQL